MHRMALGTLLLAFVVSNSGISFGSDEIRACFHEKSGKLRIETPARPCRPKEVPLVWNRTGPTGPAGPVGPAGPMGTAGMVGPPGRGLEIRDSNGDYVGIYVGSLSSVFSDYGGVIAREVNGWLVLLMLTRDGFLEQGVQLQYVTSNCSGPGYLMQGLVPPVGIFDGSEVYYGAGEPETGTVLSFSYRPYSAQSCQQGRGTLIGPETCCFAVGGFEALLTPAATFPASELGTPPYHAVAVGG